MEESTQTKIEPELYKFFEQYVRPAEVAFWKLIIVLAGGALTLSIGFLLREAGQPFPKLLLPTVECAWGALLVCLGVAVAQYALSYWAMAKQARLWEDLRGLAKRPFRFLRWPERVGWVMFVIAIVSLATGLVQLARVALALLSAHAVQGDKLTASHADETKEIAKALEKAVANATKPRQERKQSLLQLSAKGLTEAAELVKDTAPNILTTAGLIAKFIVGL